jgi:hypothetical protein
MTDHHCLCGHAAASADDLADHLAEMFAADDDAAADGQRHAEAADDPSRPAMPAARKCLCGFEAAGIAQLDAHLLAVFTPSDSVGHDGNRHAATVSRQANPLL